MKIEMPKKVIIDFEKSAFNAFKKASKHSQLFFCLFHFGQIIWRKVQKLGLANIYIKNADFRLYIKCFTSLAFVPPENVLNEFKKLQEKSKEFNFPEVICFIEYFEKNFIKNCKYERLSWNAYERLMDGTDLTTNAAESFHRHLYARFEQSHSGLETFIDKLKETQSLVEQDINFLLCNPSSSENSKKIAKLSKLKDIASNYNRYYGLFYLESISKTYHWKLD